MKYDKCHASISLLFFFFFFVTFFSNQDLSKRSYDKNTHGEGFYYGKNLPICEFWETHNCEVQASNQSMRLQYITSRVTTVRYPHVGRVCVFSEDIRS